ncbi:MAG: dTMP kinase [Candidatus Zixiibacteriota bacterium]
MKSPRRERGLFVTFEGIDGCGKSTQLERTGHYLKVRGYDVVKLREPGSTPVAESIRRILLDRNSSLSDTTELLLYEAARADITAREIIPHLEAGRIVLCDRFYDSTTAYQGYGRGLDLKMVRQLHRMAVGQCRPDLTLVFDISLKVAATRLGPKRDRLEAEPAAFHRRVRRGFLRIAESEPGRVKVVDGTPSVDTVFEEVKKHLDRKLRRL